MAKHLVIAFSVLGLVLGVADGAFARASDTPFQIRLR